uniref:Uncharacterized protein n=1 Tax=Timema bartmani TaxID=61472 RepID=A0A7R9FBS5_9NEOP|nr:unnamed protein product [Timema bartmani]
MLRRFFFNPEATKYNNILIGVTEVQEDLEYKVDFLAGGVNMVLLVSLSLDFPLDKPVLKVQPLVIHPWVNEHSEIVSAPGLLNSPYRRACEMVHESWYLQFIRAAIQLT